MKKEKLSFVIPCYNSTHTVGAVVDEISTMMQEKMADYLYEIILVNDCSPDGTTYDAIVEVAKRNKCVIGINLARNFGQPSAVMAGLNHASGDYVVCGDDDGQTPFCDFPLLFAKIKEGYDVVEAKYSEREKRSTFRKLGTFLNESMATWLISKPKGIVLTTYWVIRKFVADEMKKYPNSYPYLGGLMMRATQNVCNVEVTHRKRLTGKSGYNLGKMIDLWLSGFTSFSIKPLRITTFLGIITAFVGFVSGVVTIINKIINPSIMAGYSSMMAVILILFGILFVLLGMMGEYLGRVYISLNNAPQYVIKDMCMYGENELDEKN